MGVKNKNSNVLTVFVEDKEKIPTYKYHYKKWLFNGYIKESVTKSNKP